MHILLDLDGTVIIANPLPGTDRGKLHPRFLEFKEWVEHGGHNITVWSSHYDGRAIADLMGFDYKHKDTPGNPEADVLIDDCGDQFGDLCSVDKVYLSLDHFLANHPRVIKMNKLTVTELVQGHCKLTQKWAVVLYPDLCEDFDFEELKKAVPFLEINKRDKIVHRKGATPAQNDDTQAIVDGLMIVLCNSEDECDRIFEQIRGDDKPNNNEYDGLCRVYAWTCNSDGEILTENT